MGKKLIVFDHSGIKAALSAARRASGRDNERLLHLRLVAAGDGTVTSASA